MYSFLEIRVRTLELRDHVLRLDLAHVFRTWNVAFAFSATGLKSLRVAAFLRESKSLAGACEQLLRLVERHPRLDGHAVLLRSGVLDVEVLAAPASDDDLVRDSPAGPVSCTMIAAAAPLSDAISYL